MVQTSLIPEGCTFLNYETMLTVAAKDALLEMSKKIDDRNPDAHDMYIYNDFFSYGTLEVVDRTMSTIHTKLAVTNSRDLDGAYSLLEALTVIMNHEPQWAHVDDGHHVRYTANAYGALVVALLRGLHKRGRLNTECFPTLEYFLRNVASVGDMLPIQDVANVVRGVGKNLFKDKTEEDFALEKRRYEEWEQSVKNEEDEDEGTKDAEMNKNDKSNEDEDEDEDEEEKGKPWYTKGSAWDLNMRNSDLSLWPVWKAYKAFLAQDSPGPAMGGQWWDISDWTNAEKKPFLFSTMRDSMDLA